MREGEVWIDRTQDQRKAEAEQRARADEIRARYPKNRQGRRAAERAVRRVRS